ncbi:Alpha/Beta hydrolase protein [Ochromonadaceae sp. CCMP2298]|nr:Alpha/Beta hydrolase protein [Ochromonadaceae sp. CCMP2298]|mmetsp:Transcript_18894/g.42079  ORF Transcript_18894/g.42079 Transcript_18894/m.42079 type:complete len:378 (+) Transcript_18894:87-1220(+)
MRTACEPNVGPIVNSQWWNSHVSYSKFRRQGIDIVCASFKQKNAKANVVFVTGLMESFVKYSETIQYFYEKGFNVFTYDHQSQGLSGRWLSESQSLWINSFDDYVDDFVYFVTAVSTESSHLPVFLVAHSMGGLIASMAMSRQPTLISRAVLCAPMIRNKCGLKALDYQYPLPQPVAYWLTYLACYSGLGSMHAMGFFKEKPTDKLPLHVTTSDPEQLQAWRDLRMRHPCLIATCVTNDWLIHSIRAQNKFSHRYETVRTNTLILSAETDYFVNNRAIVAFAKKAPAAKLLTVPDSFHELLQEREPVRAATRKVISDFFSQKSDSVALVEPCFPLLEFDHSRPMYSVPELIGRGGGLLLAAAGFLAGIAMILGDRKR